MKIRFGFVSNSSSSSFIIGFKKTPMNVDELHTIMFPDGPTDISPYGESMTSKEVCERVFADMQKQFPNDLNKFIEAGIPYEDDNIPSYHDMENDPKYWLPGKIKQGPNDLSFRDYDWKKMSEDRRKLEAEYFLNYQTKHPDLIWYIFDYADDGGDGIMEHGGIFANLEGYTVSHH